MTFKLALLLALAALGCGRIAVDTAGLPCPCGDGNECDTQCNVCVPPGTPAGVACSDCRISFRDFHADWVTPNSIGWRWEVLDPEAGGDFGAYTLTLTSSEGTRVYDATTNPELGVFNLPYHGRDLVQTSITDGLSPNVVYTGTLTARDERNCEFSATSIARATIQPARSVAIELFGETSAGHIAAQDGLVVSDDCYSGESCLQSPAPACLLQNGSADCSNLLKYAGLDIPITDDNLTPGQFEDAYLEAWTKSTAPSPTWYGWVWLRTVDPDQIFAHFAITLPNNQDYKRVQIPLRELTLQGGSEQLTRDILARGRIREFVLGSIVEPSNTVIRVDEAYIRR